jgi:glycine cleavage system aminomethyltransferase T
MLTGRPIYADGTQISYVQAADYGYSIGASIVYAYLPTAHTAPGTAVSIHSEGQEYPATVREEPLFDPQRAKLLP